MWWLCSGEQIRTRAKGPHVCVLGVLGVLVLAGGWPMGACDAKVSSAISTLVQRLLLHPVARDGLSDERRGGIGPLSLALLLLLLLLSSFPPFPCSAWTAGRVKTG